VKPQSLKLPGAHGLTLHALEWSDVGAPLILLHGFGLDAHVWDEVAPRLAPAFRTVALDLRGHGDSDRDAERRYSHAAIGRDLEAVTRALGAEPCVLVGHSMGAYGALHLCARHPERVRALGLVDAGPDLTSRGVSSMRFRSLDEEPSFGNCAEYERVLARSHPLAAPETLARLARYGLRPRDDGRLVPKLDIAFMRPRHGYDPSRDRAAWAERESAYLREVLEGLRVPTRVIRGAESPVLRRETAQWMVGELLADGSLEEIPRAGHAVMLDNPQGLADALNRFLQRAVANAG
jgi:pimeloyl-ACP methyl ester carboxylesterase